MKKILVLGGAGYIGSACVKVLCDQGFSVTVIDDLSTGDKKYIDEKAKFFQKDIAEDKNAIDQHYDCVFHFAAHKFAGESMLNATKYSRNITGMINVLDAMVRHKIPKIIFSSSAAVYGHPQYLPIDEKHPLNPCNYYGFTKLKCEELIDWYSSIHGITYSSLRYFNVVGDLGLKYQERSSSNLFPVVMDVLSGKKDKLQIFGNDYETHDGTCIRDYVHLEDLIEAHILAMKQEGSDIFNLGTNTGYTVNEIIEEFEKQLDKKISKELAPRRAGDPARLVASSKKAETTLGWQVKKNLQEMIKSTLKTNE